MGGGWVRGEGRGEAPETRVNEAHNCQSHAKSPLPPPPLSPLTALLA